MEEKARKGEWNGGKPPLGYDLVDKKLIINDEESKVVELIFEEYLKGKGYLAIVDVLKGKGYTTKRGNNFSGNTVYFWECFRVRGRRENPTINNYTTKYNRFK